MPALDPRKLRSDFPILSQTVNGKPLVYLDNAATTQKPRSVIDALTRYYTRTNANIHRGIHTLSEEATDQFEAVRTQVAAFIHTPHTESIIFTRGTTESINLVAYSWGRNNLLPGDEILLSEMEHHSNLIPWQQVADVTGCKLQFIPITQDGKLEMDRLPGLLTEKTKLVALTLLSNVLGTINVKEVREITAKAHAVGALVLADAAQAIPHLEINVIDLDVDFLAFSAHKMLGPTGVGVLYGKKEILEEMEPFQGGGDMILEVWKDHVTYNELPYKFEAGTPDIAGVIALGPAIDYLQKVGLDAIRTHEQTLIKAAIEKLQSECGATLYGPLNEQDRSGVVSFNLPGGIHPHDVGTLLNEQGIAIRAGHHCCQPLMRHYDIPGTARASFYLYNTMEEVDALIQALKKAATVFSH